MSQDCTAPGGGKHPNREADWATYNKKVEEEARLAKEREQEALREAKKAEEG